MIDKSSELILKIILWLFVIVAGVGCLASLVGLTVIIIWACKL